MEDAHNLTSSLYRQQSEQNAMAWMKFLADKHPATYRHCVRVAIMAEKLANCLAMNEDDKGKLVIGCFLHDVGKGLLPIELWNQKEALSREQWQTVRLHSTVGSDLMQANSALGPEILDVIRHHHENWDGTGYPDGLAGEEIPYLARVCAVVAAFDSMLTEYPYVKMGSLEEAKQELVRSSGTQFDSRIVQAFLKLPNAMLDIYMH